MKTIGILGGLGPESTAAYYQIITRRYFDLRADYAYPQIVVYSVNFQQYIDLGYEAPDEVRGAIEALARAGAEFVVAACNSVHIVYDQLSPVVPIPWVSIMDAAAESVKESGIRTVGLLGTVFTMGKGFYQRAFSRHGLQTLTPGPEAQARINSIIYDELVRAIVKDESRQFVLGCMAELASAGAEGIVLGCTELPFLIRQSDTDIPVFDTTTIHARKALALALEDAES